MWQKIWNAILELFGKPPEYDIRAIDLPAELDARAKDDGRGLQWKTSVVDFLKLLKIDSSVENREELANELGVDAKLAVGSAERNEALRLALFKKLEENGGKVPPELLD